MKIKKDWPFENVFQSKAHRDLVLVFKERILREDAKHAQRIMEEDNPKDIWTNLHIWTPKPVCKAGDKCHDAQPRTYERKVAVGAIGHGTQGMKNATERGMIPQELCLEICNVCEAIMSEKWLSKVPVRLDMVMNGD